jgi:hypothetical protein
MCFFFTILGGGGASTPDSFSVRLFINGFETTFMFFASFGVGVVLVLVFFASFYHKRGFGVAVSNLIIHKRVSVTSFGRRQF